MAISDLSAVSGISPLYEIPKPTPSDTYLAGEGQATQRLRLQIERIGPHFRTVLVRGEMGTGKELVARALHARSSSADGPFVICHAIRLAETNEEEREDLLVRSLLERTRGGTLFLDGVEEMSPDAQGLLLRMLEHRSGSRMIASTCQDLRAMAASGAFRHDLYHRLTMVEILLDPLRKRPEDIPALATHFLEKFSSQYEKSIDGLAHDAMQKLLSYAWPGNVRELENVIHNGVLQCDDTVLGVADLSSLVDLSVTVESTELQRADAAIRLQDVIDRHVLRVLRECSGNKVRAAEMLGISRSTLYRMLEGCSAQTNLSKI